MTLMPKSSYAMGTVETTTVHDAITADVAVESAVPVNCSGARAIMLEFTEAGTVNNRQCDLTVYASVDGTTYTQYNMLINNETNDAGDGGSGVEIGLTRIATKNRASAGTDILWFTPETLGAIREFKVAMDVTDGATPTGNFTVKATVCR